MPELNTGQAAAVYSDASRILCLAGAGTGKTYCMIKRIIRLVESGVDPDSILVLTFTNAAALEMKQRYRKNCKCKRSPEFRTFHSFCYYVISTDKVIRMALGYTQIPKVINDNQLKQIKINVRNATGIQLSNSILFEEPSVLSKDDEFKLSVYNKALKKTLQAENVITFDSLLSSICEMFSSHDDKIKDYLNKYKYIFVDEFQDTDPKQFKFVSAFESANHFYVGDASQAIYGFRNADSSIIKRLSEDESWTIVKLSENYRSTEQICDYANRIFEPDESEYRINLHSPRSGVQVNEICVAYKYFSDTINPKILSKIVSYLHNSQGTTAILARTNQECSDIVDYLSDCGIKCKISKPSGEVMNILDSICDNTTLTDWLSTYLRSDEYAEYCRLCIINESENRYGDLEKIDARLSILRNDFYDKNFNLRRNMNTVMNIRKNLTRKELTKLDRVNAIIESLDLSDIFDNPIENSQIAELKTLKDAVCWIKNQIEANNDSSVYVGTVHSSKGLEYDNVYLVGVDSKRFRLDYEENLNLYYVGATRAKSRLTVFKHLQKEAQDEYLCNQHNKIT